MVRALVALILLMLSIPAVAQVTAKSWLVADDQGRIIDSAQPGEVRPIASITKLITALVVLDGGQDLDQLIPLSSKIHDALPRNKHLSRREVMYLALVKSDNRAAQTLCEQYSGGFGACIAAMNAKMASLGMENSRVFEPTGLDRRNVSTAHDLMKLVLAAVRYPEIVEASRTASVHIWTNFTKLIKKKRRRQRIVVSGLAAFHNTNPLVRTGAEPILVSKTGYTSAAGGCLATLMKDRVVIVLGSRNTHTRISEAQRLSHL